MKADNSITLMGRIKEKTNEFLMQELAKQGITDIVTSHALIIYNLFKHKELTRGEIAQKIDRDKSTVTGLLAKLQNREYITSRKDPDDSRYSYISLTEKGKKLPPIFKNISSLLYQKEYSGISEEKREIFLKVLNDVLKNFK